MANRIRDLPLYRRIIFWLFPSWKEDYMLANNEAFVELCRLIVEAVESPDFDITKVQVGSHPFKS